MQILRSELEAKGWFNGEDYPFQSRYIDLTWGRMHYVDEGAGEAIVFVHGTPSWSYEFHAEIKELSKTYRCVAMDHLGFGLSERPENWDYAVESHRKSFSQFIDRLGIKRFSLVMHDFGGPIALPWAIAHPGQILSMALSNSWFWPFEVIDADFARRKRWLDSAFMKFAYLRLNFSAQMLVKMAWGRRRPLDHRTHNHYRKLFPNSKSRIGAWALAQALVHPQNDFLDFEKTFSALRGIPTLLLWGEEDRFVKKIHLEKWRSLLPEAKVVTLPDVGHFTLNEAPELVNPQLSSFFENR
ncbi:MAG TPA: alpha/beta fold hydrolase [Blastocatellia bacterium]|jgi:haloalkane dehalogenase|nr:alpha/beta fold hydrolase [Blastocatellia bacterium]